MFVHFLDGAMADAAMPWKNPLEWISEQILHRARLFRPGIPANIAEGGQGFAFGRPREMVPCEKHFIAIQKNLVAARVSGRGDELEIVVDTHRSRPRNDALDAARRGAVRLMHDAGAMEVRSKFGVVRNIIAMREEHKIYAAHFLDAFRERIVETRRIDEDVAALLRWAHDQVGPRAEARLRIESAIVNVIHDVNGKSLDAGAGAAMGHSADGSGRARDKRHQCPMQFAGILRLMEDARFAAVVAKTRGRNLAARVAIDATRVHEEFACNILRETFVNLRHRLFDSFRAAQVVL
jgi:hypothetical protein